MSTAPHLAIEGVRKLYGEVTALDDVSLSVGAHDYVVLLGPSGSGKTTLLSLIGGFAFPTSGRVLIAGRDVTALGPATRPTTTLPSANAAWYQRSDGPLKGGTGRLPPWKENSTSTITGRKMKT